MFCSDHRPKIKEDNPGIAIGDIAKKLGEMWGRLSDKDKAPYVAKAAKLKEKYEKVSADLPPHVLEVFFNHQLWFSWLYISPSDQDVAAYRAKSGPGKVDAGKKSGPGRPAGKKAVPMDDDDDDDDEDEDDEEDDDDDDEDDD